MHMEHLKPENVRSEVNWQISMVNSELAGRSGPVSIYHSLYYGTIEHFQMLGYKVDKKVLSGCDCYTFTKIY